MGNPGSAAESIIVKVTWVGWGGGYRKHGTRWREDLGTFMMRMMGSRQLSFSIQMSLRDTRGDTEKIQWTKIGERRDNKWIDTGTEEFSVAGKSSISPWSFLARAIFGSISSLSSSFHRCDLWMIKPRRNQTFLSPNDDEVKCWLVPSTILVLFWVFVLEIWWSKLLWRYL